MLTVQSLSPNSFLLTNSTSPSSAGFNTPSTIIEMSPDIKPERDEEPTSDIIHSMLTDVVDDKLTFYYSKAVGDNDDEQIYSDSSNSSSSNNWKTKRRYFFSRPIENLHRGRPAHGGDNFHGKTRTRESGYSFGSYEPSFAGRILTTRAARKANLMAELFGEKLDERLENAVGADEPDTSSASRHKLNDLGRDDSEARCQEWLNQADADSYKQNFGHSPFAYDEIAPRSRRSGLNDQRRRKSSLFSGLNTQQSF